MPKKLHVKELIAQLSEQEIFCTVSSEVGDVDILTISMSGWYDKDSGEQVDLASQLTLPVDCLETYKEFLDRIVKLMED